MMKLTPMLAAAILSVSMVACQSAPQSGEAPANPPAADTAATPITPAPPAVLKDTVGLPDSAFVDLSLFGDAFAFDLRYATDNNFTGKTVYPCAVCKTRYGVAKALLQVAEGLKPQGLKLKFYDCYRPVAVQRIFWEIMPDARYVANPNTSGSIHNRGAAVDLTLVNRQGEELTMGTDFDHFEEEAHHSYTQLPDSVLEHRRTLKTAMEAAGFSSIRTEWWHYLYGNKSQYTLADEPLCEEQ